MLGTDFGFVGLVFALFLGIVALETESRRLESSNEASSQQSLPPDTFRKLAQALYQRGDKVENRLSKKLFYNRNITCNDGSTAGYYMRRNVHSKRWVIFLEGGWYCYDNASCESRWMRLRSLMSSERWPSVKTIGGILSSDPKENPHFSDANHILIPYCSSDSWSGTSLSGKTGSRFSFMGAYIIQEVINELVYYEKLLQGTELYLSGSSAGGTGVLLNVDSVADSIKKFGRNELLVRGISDSGWFLDSNPFSPRSDGCDQKGNCSPIGAVKKGTRLWKAKVHSKCRETFGNEISNCFFGYKVYPLIKSPLFIFQWQFDEAQMIADNVGAPVTKAQWNFIHRMGDQLRGSFNNVSAVFSPACISHSVLTKRSWVTIEVDGVTLPNALDCWIKSLHKPTFSYSEAFNNLQVQDHVKVSVLSPLSKRGISSSMLADAPKYVYSTKDRFKELLSENLIRSASSEDNTRNSIASRLKNQKKKPSSLVDNEDAAQDSSAQSQTRAQKSISPRRKRNRRARRRLKKLRQKCKRHNDAACAEFFKPFNTDLIRSMGRRSSKRMGKKHHNSRKKKNRKKSENNKKKRNKKKKKKEQRRKRKERRRLEKLNRRRQERKLKPRSVLYVPSTGPPLKTALHSYPQKCSLKHVDNCSWPQCNRSCPKLRNPATGEEMDFLELLKSFGLDMQNVARALGVDYATLKGMDKDVLLHLLTSQPNS